MARRSTAPKQAAPDKNERELRLYCEKLKASRSMSTSRGSAKIIASGGQRLAAPKGGDPLAQALIYHAQMSAPAYVGSADGRALLGEELPNDPKADLLVKLISGFYNITDKVRRQLIILLEETRVDNAQWWGAELTLTEKGSRALQELIGISPDLGAILALMAVSRTASLIYIVVSASGKLLADRLKERTTTKGVKAVIYFYLVPFIDPIS